MKKIVLVLIVIATNALNAQSIPITGNSYHIYGPNSNWGEYMKVGGNGRETTSASVVATNGNLHLDSKDGPGFATYINNYSKGNTFINPDGGNVGIGNYSPDDPLTVYGISRFYPKRTGGGDARNLSINFSLTNPDFLNNLYPVILATGGGNQPLILDASRVGIGTSNPDSKLAVNGTIHSKEVKVDMLGWSDFVFKKEYDLPTLQEVEKHIAEKGHLENIPTEKEVLENGINLGEMNAKLLQKIEELTLYSIQQNKKIEQQSKEIESLKGLVLRVAKIENELGKK